MTLRMADRSIQLGVLPARPEARSEGCASVVVSEADGNDPGGSGRRVYLETFGCQMNELDSELVRGHLGALGYCFTADQREADVVLFNTCSVREQAENKVLSRVGLLGLEKKDGREVVVGLLGCLSEREGEGLLSKYPQIDLLCGPGELDKLPVLLDNICKTQQVARADRVALQTTTSNCSICLARLIPIVVSMPGPVWRQAGLPMFASHAAATSSARTVSCPTHAGRRCIARRMPSSRNAVGWPMRA